MIPILRLVHILYTLEFVYSEQAYNEVKINPNRYLNNVFLKAYYKFFLMKIRLITKSFLNPNNVFIIQNWPDITKKIAEQTNRLPVFRYARTITY
jgi:hypothetical protein